MMRFTTSVPCCARATRGEHSGVMHWIDSIIVWSHIALKSRFRLRIILVFGIRASDASDLPMMGYLLELLCDGSLTGAIIMMR
jgi:hypothetical protein